MTKILILNNAYPTKNNPKKGSYVKSIVDCLINVNLKVDILVMSSGSSLLNYISYYFKLLFFDFSKYDYVYINHYPNMFLPLIFKYHSMSNIVINFHGGDVSHTNRFQYFLNKISYFFIPKKAEFIVPSLYFKEITLKRIPKLKNKSIHISPSGGVNMKIFKPLQKSKKGKINIGFASGLDLNKGVEVLIELIKNINSSEYVFHIINYGRDKKKYLEEILYFQNILIYDTFEKNRMPEFYDKIDVLFFPSKSESLGLVALEAMSCNVPVVGPDKHALKQIIQNGISGEKYYDSKIEKVIKALTLCVNQIYTYEPRDYIEKNYSSDAVEKQLSKIFNRKKNV